MNPDEQRLRVLENWTKEDRIESFQSFCIGFRKHDVDS